MSYKVTTTAICDQCGAEVKDSQPGWMRLRFESPSGALYDAEHVALCIYLEKAAIKIEVPRGADCLDFCGGECWANYTQAANPEPKQGSYSSIEDLFGMKAGS